MKMKRVKVEFTKKIEVTVYVPETTTQREVVNVVQNLAFDGLHDWDEPSWSGFVGRLENVDVPDEHCVMETRPARFGTGTVTLPPRDTTFTGEDVVVLDDDGTDLVSPTDATWWRIETPSATEDAS